MNPTCTIPLTRGFHATVSAEDYESLSQFEWSAVFKPHPRSWYAVRFAAVNGKRTTISMARQILGLEIGDTRQADHIDHDTLDNSRENLRAVTRKENCQNRRKRSDNTSTFKGVSWNRRASKWRVQIWINGSNRLIGHYSDPVEAAKAYDAAARREFGPYALCNFADPGFMLAEAA